MTWANNMGPAVGAGAMTMTMDWATLVAAVFEALGAIIASGDVVGTIQGGIIDIRQITDASQTDPYRGEGNTGLGNKRAYAMRWWPR